MTAYSAGCEQCHQHCDWMEMPKGGRWVHRDSLCHQVSADGEWVHDHHWPVIDWQPMEHTDDDGNWVTM